VVDVVDVVVDTVFTSALEVKEVFCEFTTLDALEVSAVATVVDRSSAILFILIRSSIALIFLLILGGDSLAIKLRGGTVIRCADVFSGEVAVACVLTEYTCCGIGLGRCNTGGFRMPRLRPLTN